MALSQEWHPDGLCYDRFGNVGGPADAAFRCGGIVLKPAPMRHYLDFEKPIAELEGKIEELRRMSEPDGLNIAEEVSRLTSVADRQLRTTYAKLTPWQKTQVARHPDRPKAMDYIASADQRLHAAGGRSRLRRRCGGAGRAGTLPRAVGDGAGTEKGSDTDSRVKHNFGMARPEGYRKARRLIELAGRFGLPVLSFVDTPGAFPGIDAEAHGQAEAIARSIEACLEAPVPLVATIIGEGGSGGAIALAAGDRVLMLEHAIYSVISPEGCASILWRDAAQATAAAEALRLTAEDLKRLDLVDVVIPEPLGGAQRDAAATIAAVGDTVAQALLPLVGLDGPTLKARRRERFLNAGREGLG